VTLAGTVARIWSHSAAIAAAGILAILGMIVGTVLLVIPGVIVGVSLSMTTAAVVVEDRAPLAALKRSRELTRGHLWVLSALFLGWLAVSTTTAMIEVAICSPGVPWFTAMTAPLFALIVNPISATLLSTVLTVGVATAYLQLADLKRSAMAETFD
jgi:hypothetical protein